MPVTFVVNIRCRTCGNEDEWEIADDHVGGMLVPNTTIRAEAKVRECLLCKRPLVLAK